MKTSDTFFNAYHQFNGWSLSDDSAQMVEPSENWQTSKEFTFTMPGSAVTVPAAFGQERGGVVADVPNSAYYADAVKWAVAQGITNGKGSGLFGSNDACTRAQIVTFLWRDMA